MRLAVYMHWRNSSQWQTNSTYRKPYEWGYFWVFNQMGNGLHRPISPIEMPVEWITPQTVKENAAAIPKPVTHPDFLHFTQPLSFNHSPLHYSGVCQCYQQSVMPHHYIPTLSALSGCNPVTLAPPQLRPVCVSVSKWTERLIQWSVQLWIMELCNIPCRTVSFFNRPFAFILF